MPRVAHGEVATLEQLQAAERELASHAARTELGFAVTAPAGLQEFDFLFLDLQDDDANLLPTSATTVKRLKELGATMQGPGAGGDPDVPAIYNYFGQFVDHDVTLEASSFSMQQLLAPNLAPLGLDKIRTEPKKPAHRQPGPGQPVRPPATPPRRVLRVPRACLRPIRGA